MPDEDAQVGGAERARRLDELRLAQAHDVCPDRTRDERPHEGREHEDERVRPDRPEVDERRKGEDDRGIGGHEVGDPHERGVEPAAEVAREEPHGDAEERCEGGGGERDLLGRSNAVDRPLEHVAADVVGPEQVRQRLTDSNDS